LCVNPRLVRAEDGRVRETRWTTLIRICLLTKVKSGGTMTRRPGPNFKGEVMLTIIRRVGIAIGSLVIAYLGVSLVAGVLLGQSAQSNPIVVGVIVVLGGLVYADLMRRERRRSLADSAPTA